MAPANCSVCGRSHEIETWQSINVISEPALKDRVRDGSLFVWECPSCGHRNLATYPLLYHDPQEKLMLWLLPQGTELPRQADALAESLEGYVLRRVSDTGSLIEKIKIHEAGLDDRVMEMCKWVTAMELAGKGGDNSDEILGASMRFLRMDGADGEITLAYPFKGEMHLSAIGFNVYEDCRGILGRNAAAAEVRGFAEVDALWLASFFRQG